MSYDELKEKHSVACLHIYNTIQQIILQAQRDTFT